MVDFTTQIRNMIEDGATPTDILESLAAVLSDYADEMTVTEGDDTFRWSESTSASPSDLRTAINNLRSFQPF